MVVGVCVYVCFFLSLPPSPPNHMKSNFVRDLGVVETELENLRAGFRIRIKDFELVEIRIMIKCFGLV